jgi:hypothetical protein
MYNLCHKCKTITTQYKKIVWFHPVFKVLLERVKENYCCFLFYFFNISLANTISRCIFALAMRK